MHTRPEHRREHGGHRTRWLAVLAAALGAALVVGVSWASGAVRTTAPDGGAAGAAAPYVVEPPVTLTAAGTPDRERAERRPHRLADAGVPQRLVVPALGVDAPVVPVGVTDGVLTPPADPQTLGWWADGAEPGAARGGALVTGHTVHTGGGALDDLETLRRGDTVTVRTAAGVLRYAVGDVTVYRKASLAADAARVFSQDVSGRLVLITCEDWNGSGYDSNVVVLADPVG